MRRRGRVERWRDEEKAAVFVLAFATCLFLGYFVQKLCIISHREKKKSKSLYLSYFPWGFTFCFFNFFPLLSFFSNQNTYKIQRRKPHVIKIRFLRNQTRKRKYGHL